MNLELYEPRRHFPLVYGWWKDHRGASLDLDSLGTNGLVAWDGDQPIAAAWLFLSNAKLAQIGWPVTNPEASMRKKSEAVTVLIQALTAIAKENGYTRLMTFSSSKGLTRKFQREGFTKLVPHDLLIRAL